MIVSFEFVSFVVSVLALQIVKLNAKLLWVRSTIFGCVFEASNIILLQCLQCCACWAEARAHRFNSTKQKENCNHQTKINRSLTTERENRVRRLFSWNRMHRTHSMHVIVYLIEQMSMHGIQIMLKFPTPAYVRNFYSKASSSFHYVRKYVKRMDSLEYTFYEQS